jgi:hypothetical protein
MMTPEKQRNELIFGLSRTGDDEVHVCFEQVAQVLGEQKAAELCFYRGTVQQANFPKSESSLIPEDKRITNFGISGFKRVPLLEALKAKPVSTPKT